MEDRVAHQQHAPPRVLVISQRTLWSAPWFSYVAEFERTLVEMLDATLVDITARNGQIASMVRHRYRLRSLLSIVPMAQAFEIPHVEDRYDLGVVIVNDLQQLGILSSLHGWRRMAEHFIAFVVELWPAWVAAARPAVDDVVARLTAVYCSVERSVADLCEQSGTDTWFVPPAVDTLSARPQRTAARRFVHVSNRGRRDPRQHATLLEWADSTDHVYEFDTGRFTEVDSHVEHRRHFYDQCGRSRFFVTNLARFDQPQFRDGAQEFGLRYFEGLASGCVLVGQHPGGGRSREVLGDARLVDMRLDATSIPAEVTRLVDDEAAMTAAGLHNRVLALRSHDVLHRWDVVRSTLSLPTSPNAEHRRSRLEAELFELSATT